MDTALTRDSDYQATTFVVIDFETTTPTGFSPEPIEVGALAFRDRQGRLRECQRFEALMQPPPHAPVTPFDTEQTGIQPSDVADKPRAGTVLADLEAALTHEPMLFVAHHAPVEAGMLHAYRDACPRLARTPVLDTVTMAKQILPRIGTYNLDHLLVWCKVPRPVNRHRAMPDVEVTARLFQHLLDRDNGHHWPTLDALTRSAARNPKAADTNTTATEPTLFDV